MLVKMSIGSQQEPGSLCLCMRTCVSLCEHRHHCISFCVCILLAFVLHSPRPSFAVHCKSREHTRTHDNLILSRLQRNGAGTQQNPYCTGPSQINLPLHSVFCNIVLICVCHPPHSPSPPTFSVSGYCSSPAVLIC